MQENYYKIGLSSHIRFRSQIIFLFLLIGFLSFFISGVYAGVKTGRLEESIVRPLANFLAEISTRDYVSSPTTNYPSFTSTSSSEVNIEVNTNQRDSSNKSFYKYKPTPYPTIATKSLKQIQKEQDEWWAKIQEEFKNTSEANKKRLEQIGIENKKSLEEFSKQGQVGIEQFKQESEQRIQEFKQKYGIQ